MLVFSCCFMDSSWTFVSIWSSCMYVSALTVQMCFQDFCYTNEILVSIFLSHLFSIHFIWLELTKVLDLKWLWKYLRWKKVISSDGVNFPFSLWRFHSSDLVGIKFDIVHKKGDGWIEFFGFCDRWSKRFLILWLAATVVEYKMKSSSDGQSPWIKLFMMLIRLVEMVSFRAEICREVSHFFISIKRKFVIFDGNMCIFNDWLSQFFENFLGCREALLILFSMIKNHGI